MRFEVTFGVVGASRTETLRVNLAAFQSTAPHNVAVNILACAAVSLRCNVSELTLKGAKQL